MGLVRYFFDFYKHVSNFYDFIKGIPYLSGVRSAGIHGKYSVAVFDID